MKLSTYLSLGFHEGRPSPTREPLALKNWKFLHCCGSFLPSWIRIRIQPTKMNVDPWGSGSGLDTQHCLKPVSSRSGCFNEYRGCVFKMSFFSYFLVALPGTLFNLYFLYFYSTFYKVSQWTYFVKIKISNLHYSSGLEHNVSFRTVST